MFTKMQLQGRGSYVFRLRVLTLNIWAVPVIGRHTQERIDGIIEHIAASEAYDVVCLQEVFLPDVWHRLTEQLDTLAGLKHHIRFVNGSDLPGQADGAGLAIFSRYPILDSAFAPFAACGRPHRVDQFDYQAGKGIGLARVLLPGDYGTADVYVSHLVAQYIDGPGDDYAEQRVLQALEAAVFIRATRRSDITLLCTDMNAGPDTLVYRMMTTLAGLKDAYSCTHTSESDLAVMSRTGSQGMTTPARTGGGASSAVAAASATPLPASPSRSQGWEGSPAPSPSPSGMEGGTLTALRPEVAPSNAAPAVVRSIYDATFGDSDNIFTNTAMNNSAVVLRRVGTFFKFLGLGAAQTEQPTCDMDARLDYVLFGSGSSAWPFTPLPVALAPSTTRAWHVVHSDIRMREPITLPKGTRINMSDHSGVYAEFACVLLRPETETGGIHLPPPPHPRSSLRVSVAGAGESEDQTGDGGVSAHLSLGAQPDTGRASLQAALLAAGVTPDKSAGSFPWGRDSEDAAGPPTPVPSVMGGAASAGGARQRRGKQSPSPTGDPSPTPMHYRGTGSGSGAGDVGEDESEGKGAADGTLLHAMSSYLRYLIVPWAEGGQEGIGGGTFGNGEGDGLSQPMSPSPRMHSLTLDGGGAGHATLRLAQLHTSPFVAQALDAAAAALHVRMSQPDDPDRARFLAPAQAGTASAVARGWRPVCREGLATLERGRGRAVALRDWQLRASILNLLWAVSMLLGAAFVDTPAASAAVDRLCAAIESVLASGLPQSLLRAMGGWWRSGARQAASASSVAAVETAAVNGAQAALYGACAGACAITLLVLGFLALMRVKNRTAMINMVVADVILLLPLSLWLAVVGGVRGMAVAGAEMCLCLAVVQSMAALVTTPQEIRGFQRAQAQLRILLQRPPAVIA